MLPAALQKLATASAALVVLRPSEATNSREWSSRRLRDLHPGPPGEFPVGEVRLPPLVGLVRLEP